MIQEEKSKAYVSFVIYLSNVFVNESDYLNFYNHINDSFENFEIIFVNDNLPLKSILDFKKVLIKYYKKSTSIINLSFEHGVEKSMQTGVDLCLGDFIFEIDEINAIHHTTLITDLFNKVLEGNDIVLMRSKKNKFTSRLFYKIFNTFSKSQYSIGSDYMRILSRRAVNRIKSLSSSIPYRKASYANSGLKTQIIFSNSINSIKSSLNKDRSNIGSTAIIIFTNFSFKFSLFFAFLFMLLTLFSSSYTILIFFNGQPVEGYTTMMLLISGSFFGVFSILAIAIKYLSVLIELIFSKKIQIVESIEKIS